MFEFCIPTKATIVPDGPEWLHEIKYDGYRLRLERDGFSERRADRKAEERPLCRPLLCQLSLSQLIGTPLAALGNRHAN